MCRHLGYVGGTVPVSEPVVRGPHSLRTQSWAPRDMRGGGTINADGFGVAWWTSFGDVRRYRNPMPIWTDPAVAEVLSQIESTAVLAAVRSATPGMPVERGACAPFTDERWAFSHNGVLPGWRTALSEWDVGATDLEAITDSAALWLLLRSLLDSMAPELALAEVIYRTAGPGARLNILLGDGESLWATTFHHSLAVLTDDSSVVVASEPYDDDPGWQPVPDGMLVTARPGSFEMQPL